MDNRTMLFALLAATLCAPAWAVNKCTGADGRVVYQEASCDATTKAAAQVKTWNVSSGGSDYEERLRRATTECGIEKMPDYPEVGWSEEKFLQCCKMSHGPSPVINRTETALGVSKQYVFDYYKAYVYVRGGKVVAIQRRN